MGEHLNKQHSESRADATDPNEWQELLQLGPDLYYQQRVLIDSQHLDYFISRYVKNKQDAEDIKQEALMRGYQALRNYYILRDKERVMKPLPWLQKITYHLICDHWKSVVLTAYISEVEEMSFQIADPTKRPDEIIEERELYQQLLEVISRLSEQEQTVVKQRYLQLRSHRDIAKMLNCSEAAARQKLRRALEKLRELWRQDQSV